MLENKSAVRLKSVKEIRWPYPLGSSAFLVKEFCQLEEVDGVEA